MFNVFYLLSTIEANCDSIFTPEALELIRECLNYFRILAPIALIVLIAVDYGSALLSNDKDNLKKATGRAVKRGIATICVFFVPTFVTVALDLAEIQGLSSNYLCTDATGTEAKKAVASTTTKNDNSTVSGETINLNNSGGSSSDGSTNGGSSTQIGDYANSSNEVCLKNQKGLRDKYQMELEARVNAAGRSTRNGVVAAAIYISSEIGIKIPYFPGGCHSVACLKKGIPSNVGCQTKVVHNAHKWPSTLPAGFDCSGFTFWTYGAAFGSKTMISSEMHNYGNSSTKIYNEKTGETVRVKVERVNITNDNINYIKNLLMPGDLAGTDGHVGMVIDTSRLQSEGVYTVAHASSASMQLSVETYKLAPKNKWGQVVLMRKFFLKYDCINRNNQSSCQQYDCITSKKCNSNNIKY